MPKALAKVQVSTVTPSAQELSDARAHLQALTPTQMTSKKASLRQSLTKNPDVCTTNPAGAGSILEKLHVHVQRCRVTEKKWLSQRNVEVEKNSTNR